MRRWIWMLGWTLDAGRWRLDAGRWTLEAGSWTYDIARDAGSHRRRWTLQKAVGAAQDPGSYGRRWTLQRTLYAAGDAAGDAGQDAGSCRRRFTWPWTTLGSRIQQPLSVWVRPKPRKNLRHPHTHLQRTPNAAEDASHYSG